MELGVRLRDPSDARIQEGGNAALGQAPSIYQFLPLVQGDNYSAHGRVPRRTKAGRFVSIGVLKRRGPPNCGQHAACPAVFHELRWSCPARGAPNCRRHHPVFGIASISAAKALVDAQRVCCARASAERTSHPALGSGRKSRPSLEIVRQHPGMVGDSEVQNPERGRSR